MHRLISLPEPRCPIAIGILYISGPRAMTVDCKRWRCKKCSRKHFKQEVYHLSDVTLNNEYLHEILISPEKVETVKRAIRRTKSSAWCIRFDDLRVRAITELPVKGRGWQSHEVKKIDLISDLIQNVDSTTIRRARDFTKHWKRDPPTEVNKEKGLFRWVGESLTDIEKTFSSYGESIYNDGVIGDALELAAQMKRDLGNEPWESPEEFVTFDV